MKSVFGIIVECLSGMKLLLFTIIFFHMLAPGTARSQEPYNPNSLITVAATVIEGDTLYIVDLPEVEVISLPWPENRRQRLRLTRTINHVKIAYPYAKLAGMKLREYEEILMAASSDQERKRIMKQAEKELNEQFGDDLRNLTFTQGKILIKLIDRETGETSYDLVRELRGSFTAFFYQAFARIWGFNLKDDYDPEGEDELIEQIVQLIERGQL
jgi:hypothetical protein